MKEVSPEAYKHFELMQIQYKELGELGCEELPIGIYAQWLDHVAKEKEKSDKPKILSIFTIIPKEQRLR